MEPKCVVPIGLSLSVTNAMAGLAPVVLTMVTKHPQQETLGGKKVHYSQVLEIT